MEQTADTEEPVRKKYYFRFFALIFILGAIGFALVQKWSESIAGSRVAEKITQQQQTGTSNNISSDRGTESDILVLPFIKMAGKIQQVSFVYVIFSFISLGLARWRRESFRRIWIPWILLMSVYVILELLSV